jgi:hypothetical protein
VVVFGNRAVWGQAACKHAFTLRFVNLHTHTPPQHSRPF